MSDAALEAMIDKLRGLRELTKEAAKECAPLVEAAANASADAGTTPNGQAWKPTKKGDRPLQNASKAVSARTLGTVVQIRIDGVEALHHSGTKKLPRRQIIPTAGDSLPDNIKAALVEGCTVAFKRKTGPA
jgi:hypothetical protein